MEFGKMGRQRGEIKNCGGRRIFAEGLRDEDLSAEVLTKEDEKRVVKAKCGRTDGSGSGMMSLGPISASSRSQGLKLPGAVTPARLAQVETDTAQPMPTTAQGYDETTMWEMLRPTSAKTGTKVPHGEM